MANASLRVANGVYVSPLVNSAEQGVDRTGEAVMVKKGGCRDDDNRIKTKVAESKLEANGGW